MSNNNKYKRNQSRWKHIYVMDEDKMIHDFDLDEYGRLQERLEKRKKPRRHLFDKYLNTNNNTNTNNKDNNKDVNIKDTNNKDTNSKDNNKVVLTKLKPNATTSDSDIEMSESDDGYFEEQEESDNGFLLDLNYNGFNLFDNDNIEKETDYFDQNAFYDDETISMIDNLFDF